MSRALSIPLIALSALVLSVNGKAEVVYERYPFATFAGTAGVAGSTDGASALFSNPKGVCVDKEGNVYVGDANSHTIRKITPAGVVTTLAGLAGTSGDTDGLGSAARFNGPFGVAVDSVGNVYVGDLNNHCVRKITPVGQTTTFAGDSRFVGSEDGVGTAARFFSPVGVATDAADNVYVADLNTRTIRRITPAGVVTTIAGQAGSPGSEDGSGTSARFEAPTGITIDSSNNLYVSDHKTIRKITPDGMVTTYAGSAGVSGSADGVGSAAQFYGPGGIAADESGNVFVVDYGTIRKIKTDRTVTTIAGVPAVLGAADGAGSAVRFSGAYGISLDSANYLYVGDSGNNTIRRGGPTAVSQSLNIATRLGVQTGDKVLIAGFIVTGSAQKKVVIRALGPSLTSAGVQNNLENPTLRLFDSGNALVASNDDWKINDQTELSQEFVVRQTNVPPEDDRESAVVATLAPNTPYTAIVRGKNNSTGIALVELYDLNPASDCLLANLSTRGFVQRGDDVIIGGFILGGGEGGSQILIRALGPSLVDVGVTDPLPDPTLELHNGNGALLASNNNWKSNDREAIEQTGIPPSNDLESAILAALPPGQFTAIVADDDGHTGTALVEVYDLN